MWKRILSIVSIFLAIALAVLIILGVKNEKIYCVNGGDYDSDYINCNGVTVNSKYLQCTWYPLLCSMGSCGCNASEDITFGPTIFGFDFCRGATAEFGDEYTGKTKEVKIEKAVLGEDYVINSSKIVFGGGVLDTVDGGFNIDLEAIKNNYLNVNFKQVFRVTVSITAKTDLAGAYLSMTLSSPVGSYTGNERTATSYMGNDKRLVDQNQVKEKDIIRPNTYIMTAEVSYQPYEFLSLVALQCSNLSLDVYKVVSE